MPTVSCPSGRQAKQHPPAISFPLPPPPPSPPPHLPFPFPQTGMCAFPSILQVKGIAVVAGSNILRHGTVDIGFYEDISSLQLDLMFLQTFPPVFLWLELVCSPTTNSPSVQDMSSVSLPHYTTSCGMAGGFPSFLITALNSCACVACLVPAGITAAASCCCSICMPSFHMGQDRHACAYA